MTEKTKPKQKKDPVPKKVRWLALSLSSWESADLQGGDDHKWFQAKTVTDGNCGLDAISICMKLPRDLKTYNTCRRAIAKSLVDKGLDPGIITQDKQWVDDAMVCDILLSKFKVIPIVIDGAFQAGSFAKFEALEESKKEKLVERANRSGKVVPSHHHVMFQGLDLLFNEARELHDEEKEATVYVIVKHYASHWVCLGRQSDDGTIETLFQEHEIPDVFFKKFGAYLKKVAETFGEA